MGERPDLLQAEHDAACELIGELRTACAAKDVTLKWAEAIMSIVEPRSDKAEYLECLASIRKALKD